MFPIPQLLLDFHNFILQFFRIKWVYNESGVAHTQNGIGLRKIISAYDEQDGDRRTLGGIAESLTDGQSFTLLLLRIDDNQFRQGRKPRECCIFLDWRCDLALPVWKALLKVDEVFPRRFTNNCNWLVFHNLHMCMTIIEICVFRQDDSAMLSPGTWGNGSSPRVIHISVWITVLCCYLNMTCNFSKAVHQFHNDGPFHLRRSRTRPSGRHSVRNRSLP
jgi:hypothetical protein